MDGKIIIGTSIDDSGVDKDLERLQRKLEKKKAQADIEIKNIEGTKKQIESVEKEIENLENQLDEVSPRAERLAELNNKIKLGKKLSTDEATEEMLLSMSNVDKQEEELLNKYQDAQDQLNNLNSKLVTQQEKLKDISYEYNEIIDKIKEEQQQTTKIDFKSINNGLTKTVKKVGQWALAVFGVRSAYLFLRSAINTITQNDKELANDIQAIKNALAYSIEPVIRVIVDLAKRLVGYLAYIIQAWTGRDIFASAKKNLKGASKSAKDLKKSLAGFDEINMLNGNNNADGGVGDTFKDLSKMKKPKWVEWIAKSKEFFSEMLPIVLTIFSILTKTKKPGLLIAVLGIYKTFKEIKKWLKDPTFKNFMGVLEGIALTVTGIAIAFGAWPVAIIGAIALVVATLIKNWDKIKEGFNKALEWINTTFREKMHFLLGPIGDIITNSIEYIITYIRNLLDGIISGIKRIYDGIIQITKGDLIEGLKNIFGGLLDILLSPFNALIDIIKNLWDKISKPIKDVVNKIKKALGFKVDIEINTKGGGGAGSSGSGGSGGGRAKGGIYYPKLAVGGIINQPGKGVPYHGATIGERGAEAVVPLTDSQQMALLGEAIGKYITVNLTNVTELDGRTIARKVQEVSNNTNFLLNR